MPIFDRSKDYLNARKPKTKEGQSSEDIIKIQEEYKQKMKDVIAQFYRDFIKLLNKHKIVKFARLMYNEQISLKLPMSNADYVNGIYAFATDTEQIKFFMRKAKEDTQTTENVTELCTAFLNIFVEKPEDYTRFIEELIASLVVTKKMTLNPELINLCITCTLKAGLTAEFSRLFNFLMENPHHTKKNTRLLCYRLLNQSKDELAKPQLLGLVEKYFGSTSIREKVDTRGRRGESQEAQKGKPKEQVVEKPAEKQEEKAAESTEKVSPKKEKAEKGAKGAKGEKGEKGDKKVEEKAEEKKDKKDAPKKTEKQAKKEQRSEAKHSPESLLKIHNRRKVKKHNAGQGKFSFVSTELYGGGGSDE